VHEFDRILTDRHDAALARVEAVVRAGVRGVVDDGGPGGRPGREHPAQRLIGADRGAPSSTHTFEGLTGMELGLHVSDFTWPGGTPALAPTLVRMAHDAEDAGFDRISV